MSCEDHMRDGVRRTFDPETALALFGAPDLKRAVGLELRRVRRSLLDRGPKPLPAGAYMEGVA